MPRPSCIPRMTGSGTSRPTSTMDRVSPRRSTMAETSIPAAATCAGASPSAIPMAAIVFIGCTHIGASQTSPVSRLNRPPKKSAGTK
eukprot:scaffold172431_cov24-Tisochrysis_lutea.AAC.1